MNIFEQLYRMTAIQGFIDSPGTLLMLAVGFFILYLGIYTVLSWFVFSDKEF